MSPYLCEDQKRKTMKKVLFSIIAGVAALSLAGCWDIESRMDMPDIYEGSSVPLEHGMIVLGKKLQDPYTVENMTKAVESVYGTKAGRVRLEATDYYVRFRPGDDGQLEALTKLGVVLMDHPLDYAIAREGDYYHDPDIPEEEITWQYAAIPKDMAIPAGIAYEVIDECYIPEHATKTRAGEGIDWALVEQESFRLTGNAAEGTLTRAGETAVPKGRIAIVDGAYDSEPIGVAGVKVSCNSFVKFASCYTDEEGYYEMDRSFSSEPRYRLVFKNEKGFAIGLNTVLVPASVSTLGKCDASGVSLVVDKDSDRTLFTRCVVNNAGWDYWNLCGAGSPAVTLPPANLRIWIMKNLSVSATIMQQQGATVDGTVIGEFLGEYAWIAKMFLPDLVVALGGKEDYASIYAEAMHGLAHSSHFMKVGKGWWNLLLINNLKSFVTSSFTIYGTGTETGSGYTAVAEMWAYLMQCKAYRARYRGSNAVFGTEYWFKPQILLYLDERGLDCYRCFAALDEDVTSPGGLQDKLKYYYPEFKDEINQAYLRYGK